MGRSVHFSDQLRPSAATIARPELGRISSRTVGVNQVEVMMPHRCCGLVASTFIASAPAAVASPSGDVRLRRGLPSCRPRSVVVGLVGFSCGYSHFLVGRIGYLTINSALSASLRYIRPHLPCSTCTCDCALCPPDE